MDFGILVVANKDWTCGLGKDSNSRHSIFEDAMIYGMIAVDGMIIVLSILVIGSVKLEVAVSVLVLLDGCSPFLLFLGVTILLTYFFLLIF